MTFQHTIDDARAMLARVFGYTDFRPPQIRAVQAVLSGNDALIVLPTGGGKSLCFQVPALLRDGLTVVISPLISLMQDQVETLTRRGVAATFVNSTLGAREAAARMERVQARTLKLLYLAPERLETPRMLDRLATVGVSLLAVDEAHCISEWGHDFRPHYRRIGAMRERLGSPQAVALTATATPNVRADIVHQLELRRAIVVVGGFNRANLTYHVAPARTLHEKDAGALRWLRNSDGPAIVYAPTRRAVEHITAVLVRGRLRAVAYHGGLDSALRERAQHAFMTQRTRIIVATSAFGMGIDKPDVRLVVHHAMPGTLEAYYQEAGRAGRDGAHSVCVMLYGAADRFTHQHFIDCAHPTRTCIERTWRLLQHLTVGASATVVTAEQLRTRLATSGGAAALAATLRLLTDAGVLTSVPAHPSTVQLRLLATPERIVQELHGDRATDRALLRALWRLSRGTITDGALVDLRGMPHAFGRPAHLLAALDRLQSEQIVTYERTGAGFRLDPSVRELRSLPVRWDSLARRRRADLSRLDAVERYSRTPACRRAFVLRYFGDSDAEIACSGCDHCLRLPADRSIPRLLGRAVGWSRLRRT
ncbi:MAG: RecQ family ATP-dependent DNA helicase [Gemmatimonadaceae bacterium]|nr:RecQ family ATP-dependent DNA helicase [Gemmatimonadaceae bacterium]